MHQDTFMAKYKGRFSAENIKDQDLCAADEEFVGNKLWLPTKIPLGTRISDFNSEFLGMYLVLILARREGFFSGHSQEFRQELKRVNPRRFRHLHGGLGLHQGFQGFSYKQRASQHNSSPQSSREYHSIKLSKFRHPPPPKVLGFHSLVSRVSKSSRRRRQWYHHHHNHHHRRAIFIITLLFTSLSCSLRGFKGS